MLKNQFFRFSQTSTIFKLIQSCIISHAYNAQKMHFWQMLFIIIYEHHCLFPVNYLLTNCLYSVYCHLLSVYLVSIAYLLTVYCWPFIYIFYCRFYTFNCISFRECRRNDPKKIHRLHTSHGDLLYIICRNRSICWRLQHIPHGFSEAMFQSVILNSDSEKSNYSCQAYSADHGWSDKHFSVGREEVYGWKT